MRSTERRPPRPDLDEPSRDRYERRDEDHWTRLEGLIGGAGLSQRDVLKHYPAFIRRRDLPRVLAHYELFKQIVDLPGSIVELGVYLGAGLFTWGNLLETFCPGDRSRKAFGFDHHEGHRSFSPEDGAAESWSERTAGGMAASRELTNGLVLLHNDDNLLPGVERVRIIEGEIAQTVPAFAEGSLGLRLSLLYFDVNLYEPTKVGLKHLYPLVLPGGIVAFNGYGAPPWQGEALAIEEFFEGLPDQPVMKKFPFSTHPSAYFVKGAS